MRDTEGAGIAPFDLWQGTMMANASRDPLWRAVVSAEVAATPSRQEEIERACLKCHAPMAHLLGLDDHGTGSLMHVLDCDSDLGEMARDGVSCTICHGMSPEGLGTPASFSANFLLDPERRLFGPHRDPFPMPMRGMTGFTPTYGTHVMESSMCASCHTLETETLDPEGKEVGTVLLEQAPYLEWQNSAYENEGAEVGELASSCQDCHMPTTDAQHEPIQTTIARNPGGRDFPATEPRSPFGRHAFVGGNTLVLSMLRDHPEELKVSASKEALQATIDAARTQLRKHTASLQVQNVQGTEQGLRFAVTLTNHTGHKFPTAHPTRRAWLRVLVRDASGQVLFASGAHDSAGRILGQDGRPLPSELAGGPINPHPDWIRSADEVATFEAIMADANGKPTHTLMRGASWLLDDRLLPKGWSPKHSNAPRTAPIGIQDDKDFTAGGDQVHFQIQGDFPQAIKIEATLLYQSLSARWAAELLRWDTPEVKTFGRYYEQADRTPEVVTSQVWEP